MDENLQLESDKNIGLTVSAISTIFLVLYILMIKFISDPEVEVEVQFPPLQIDIERVPLTWQYNQNQQSQNHVTLEVSNDQYHTPRTF